MGNSTEELLLVGDTIWAKIWNINGNYPGDEHRRREFQEEETKKARIYVGNLNSGKQKKVAELEVTSSEEKGASRCSLLFKRQCHTVVECGLWIQTMSPVRWLRNSYLTALWFKFLTHKIGKQYITYGMIAVIPWNDLCKNSFFEERRRAC